MIWTGSGPSIIICGRSRLRAEGKHFVSATKTTAAIAIRI
jgi:hypothetical protein